MRRTININRLMKRRLISGQPADMPLFKDFIAGAAYRRRGGQASSPPANRRCAKRCERAMASCDKWPDGSHRQERKLARIGKFINI